MVRSTRARMTSCNMSSSIRLLRQSQIHYRLVMVMVMVMVMTTELAAILCGSPQVKFAPVRWRVCVQ